MDQLSICLFPLSRKIALPILQKHFNTFTVNSEHELHTQLKSHHIFCILIECQIQESEDIFVIRKICSAFPQFPCLAYGQVSEQQFYFQLAKAGLNDFVTYGNREYLLEKIQQLKEQAVFRINLNDFDIDMYQCKNYWTRKFLAFILKDYNFLEYRSVIEIANLLGTSTANLDVAFKKDCWLSPKKLLLCLRNYYAAYLLHSTIWSSQEIALRCGFINEHGFYKSFRNNTGLTVMNFRRNKHLRDYPCLYFRKYKSKMKKLYIDE